MPTFLRFLQVNTYRAITFKNFSCVCACVFYFLPLNTAESVHFIKKYLDFIMLAEPHLCGKSKNLRLFEHNLKKP